MVDIAHRETFITLLPSAKYAKDKGITEWFLKLKDNADSLPHDTKEQKLIIIEMGKWIELLLDLYNSKIVTLPITEEKAAEVMIYWAKHDRIDKTYLAQKIVESHIDPLLDTIEKAALEVTKTGLFDITETAGAVTDWLTWWKDNWWKVLILVAIIVITIIIIVYVLILQPRMEMMQQLMVGMLAGG